VVVGAGIGGLCAARAVALAGLEPIVLERSPAGTAVGAGLVLWPNAVHALDSLGLGRAVRGTATPARRTVVRDAAGRTLSEDNVEALGRRAGAPMLVIERSALHVVLAESLAVRADAEVSAVDDRGVTLARGERIDCDAVIGADGIGSVVREYVCPGAEPLDCGYTVIRGVADHDIGAGETFESWGRGELIGGAALPAGRSYWFYEAASARIDGKDRRPRSWPPRRPTEYWSIASCASMCCPRGRAGRWRFSATLRTRWSRTLPRALLRRSRTPRRCSWRCAPAGISQSRWPHTRRRGEEGHAWSFGIPHGSPAWRSRPAPARAI
jgi:2-polyprenyl-6-methoxyphenol hydroxylase-like FAD-dependent oxidoreductase